MPFQKYRKLLQEETDGVAATNENQNLVTYASLNPCKEQRLIKTQLYVVGVISWPGGHVAEWLDANNTVRNPCTDSEFAQLLSSRGAFLSVFELRVEDLALLRLDLVGQEVVTMLKSQFLVKTAALFSLYAISSPRVVVSLDPKLTGQSGYLPFLQIVMGGSIFLPSVFSEEIYTPSISVFDTDTCEDCEKARGEVGRLLRETDFFEQEAVQALMAKQPASAFNFTCFFNTSCAWGAGWCATCFQAWLDVRAGQGTYNLDTFLTEGVRGISNVAEADIVDAVNDMDETCVTLCSPSVMVGWLGNDQMGQIINSAVVMRYENGFEAMRRFSQYYGIPGALLQRLDQVRFRNRLSDIELAALEAQLSADAARS